MEIRHYLGILRRRKWVIVITTAVTLAVIAAATFISTPVFSASSTVRIAQIQDRSIDYIDLNYSIRLINTYVELVRSRPFLEEVINQLALQLDAEALKLMVSAESVPNTELLRITVESSDPDAAKLIANTLGQLLVEEGEQLYSGEGKSAREILSEQLVALEAELQQERVELQALVASESDDQPLPPEAQDLQTQINFQEQVYGTLLDAYENARLAETARANSVSIVDPAALPHEPTSPNTVLNLTLGALLGFAGGIGLAFLYENLDTSIYSADYLEQEIRAPLVGSIPNLKVPAKLRGSPVLIQPNGKSSAAEAFRILRSNILTLDHGRSPRSVLVTSVEEDAGKSTVLANLAVAMGQLGRSIVAVDTDFREPALDTIFKVSNDHGLKSVLAKGENAEVAVQPTQISGVHVLTSGPLPHNPSELLGLPKLQMLVGDLTNWADLVLLDSPPLSDFSDAVVLAPLVDSVLLVVSRGQVTRGQIDKAVAQLAKLGVDQVGLVFNRA